jgi:hypothetical protein
MQQQLAQGQRDLCVDMRQMSAAVRLPILSPRLPWPLTALHHLYLYLCATINEP